MRNSVIERLLNEPHQFSIFQAIFLLQSAHADAERIGYFNRPEDEVVRLTNVASLSFPGSQIESIQVTPTDRGDKYKLSTTIMGLYGVLSPLPIGYTASIVSFTDEGLEGRQRMRDFLDIFNHRLLSLTNRSDEYRLFNRYHPTQSEDPFVAGMLSLIGFEESSRCREIGEWMFCNLSLNSMMSCLTRSATGLKNWLKGFFPDIEMEIDQFSPHWVKLPREEQAQLGSRNCSLAGDGEDEQGGSATIGEWILDRETKFRVRTEPLNWTVFREFLPHGKEFARLVQLVSTFAPDWLQFDVEVRLQGEQCRHLHLCLDGESSQLGFTAGLFGKKGSDTDLSLILESELAAATA